MYRIHCAGKLHQHTVAGRLDDPPAMLGYGGVNEGLPDRLEPGQCAFLVPAHEAAVPGDIRRQHRCQSPFHAFGGQMMPLRSANFSQPYESTVDPCRESADFRSGSNSEVAAIANHVCSTPNSRHSRLERTLPFCAPKRTYAYKLLPPNRKVVRPPQRLH